MTVLRPEPELDLDRVTERLAADVQALLGEARRNAASVPELFRRSLALAGCLAVSDSDAPELDRALRTAGQAGAAIFALATGRGRVRVALGDGEPAELPATGPLPTAGVEAFRSAFLLAAMLRDAPTLARLATVPLNTLQQADPQVEAALLLRARALQAVWRRQPEAAAAVDAALAAVGPQEHPGARLSPAQVQHELVPELEALRAIVHGDTRELNRALERILEGHRRYRSEPHRDAPEHFLALGALGLGALAHDVGLRIEAQSDYIPLRLVHGRLDSVSLVLDGDELFDGSTGRIRFVLCRMCGSAIERRARSCGACGSDLSHSEPLEVDFSDMSALERTSCRACGESILLSAAVCPRCRTWQSASDPDELGGDEVSMRPFPPEYQIYLLARRFEPSRMAALLPGGYPSEAELLQRLRQAGHDVISAGPGRHREHGHAPWELEVELRVAGEQRAAAFRIWPTGVDELPGFERSALGGAVPGPHALVVMTSWGSAAVASGGASLLEDLHRQLRVVAAAAGDALGLLDLASGAVRSAAWLREAAVSPVPPDPDELYAIRVVRGGSKAWLHTLGLPRCGSFELELLDVPVEQAERFAALLSAAARRLVEHGEALPPEEQPFSVGEGLAVAWIPSAWARDDGESGFGSGASERVGFDRLSAVLLANGSAPIASLAPALQRDPALYASRLDAERDRLSARATWRRFVALRGAHSRDGGWQFLARVRLDDSADGATWLRVESLQGDQLDGHVLGEPPPGHGLTRGQRARFPLGRVIDWEVENQDGRITPADALAELLQARRTDLERLQAEGARTPVIIDRVTAVTMEPQAAIELHDLERPTPAVSPRLAIALSVLLPGAGHLYLGERRRGATILVGSVLTLGLCGIANAFAAWDVWRRNGLH